MLKGNAAMFVWYADGTKSFLFSTRCLLHDYGELDALA